MPTRAEMLARVRAELNDNGTVPLFAAGLLQWWLADGIFRLSAEFPPAREVNLALVDGQRDYPLPPGSVGPGGVISVEYPAGFRVPPGDTASALDGPITGNSRPFIQGWELVFTAPAQPVLRFRYPLLPVAGAGAVVAHFWGFFALPASDTDLLDLPPDLEAVLVWYCCGRGVRWLEEQRHKQGGPTKPQATNRYEALYQEGVLARRRSRGIRQFRVMV